MSKENVINFFRDCSNDSALLEKFEQKNLPEILLHTKSLGYSFSSEEIATVIGDMEAQVITQKMGEEIDAYSSLWRKMWGKSRLQYVVKELLLHFSEAELKQLIS
jgi:molybdopterin-guanine dinucleotide biosynthesis protein